jgi:thiol-disulfide isomerase/thioredoxin
MLLRRSLSFATALILLAMPAAQAALRPGSAAPEFTLEGRGAKVSLNAFRGKLVYLDFWASWCAPCKRSFPWMNGLQQRYGAAGLQVVAINVDSSRDDAERFLATTPANFTVAFDPAGAIPKAYAILGMPSSFLIGPDGQVLLAHTGYTGATAGAIEDAIDKALQPKKGH